MSLPPFSAIEPFILPYEGVAPRFGEGPHAFGARSSVLGRAEIGARTWLGPRAVVRADGHFVRLGDDFHLGEAGTVHIAHEVHPCVVGDRVSAGRNAVIHACAVGDDCVFEDDVVILDGSVVSSGVVIEAGSVVFPRSELKGGQLYAGAPAKPLRALEAGELAERRAALDRRIAASLAGDEASPAPPERGVFCAATAAVSGEVRFGAQSSVFFSCEVHAGLGAITLGENVNVQDNSVLTGSVRIGRDTTIGHNVTMTDCVVGERALIGIGATLAPGTMVEDDVLVAAGAVTRPGQRLEAGSLWGGRPARVLSRLSEAKGAGMAEIVPMYRFYGRFYAAAQRASRSDGGSDGSRRVPGSRSPA